MIRVIARHIDEADGVLVGDYPPSEIDALVELLGSARVHLSDEDYVDVDLLRDANSLQFIVDTTGRYPRMVLEILFE